MSTDTAISVLFLIVLAVSALAALHGRVRRGVPLGLGVRGGTGRDLAAGLAIGSAGMAATVAAVVALTPTAFHDVRLDAAKLAYATAVLAVAAVGEEVVYRALMLGGLARLTGRPAVALAAAAAVFGLVHLTGSPDATVISVLSNALGGVMYGVAFLRTGRIWMGVGVHFAWNFVQGPVAGFPVSDETSFSGALLRPVTEGAQWLTGGAYGPEGSVLSLVFRVAIIAMTVAATARRPGGAPARPHPDPAAS